MADQRARRPRSVYGHGEEPDARMSLANERTFLAWIRTALALLAGAAAVDALDLAVSARVQTMLAIALSLSALGSALSAWRSWALTESALRDGRPLPANPAMLVVLAAVVVTALVLAFGPVLG